MQQAIDSYLRKLKREGASPATIQGYGRWLGELARHVGEATLVRDLTVWDVEDWQDSLHQPRPHAPRGLAPKSRSIAHTAARSWASWAVDEELLSWRVYRAILTVKVGKKLPRPVPLEDLEAIRAHLGRIGRGSTMRELRDRALFHVLVTSGFRIAENLQLTRDEWRHAVVTQKGGDEKALQIPPVVQGWVRQYLAARQDDLPWLWVTTERGQTRPLTDAACNAIWRRLAGQLGIARWTNHRLRDTCATELADAGLPIEIIAEHMGHVNLETTRRYIKVAQRRRAEKMAALEEIAKGGLDKLTTTMPGFLRPARVRSGREVVQNRKAEAARRPNSRRRER